MKTLIFRRRAFEKAIQGRWSPIKLNLYCSFAKPNLIVLRMLRYKQLINLTMAVNYFLLCG